jgi:solute:Na+ symporter, SSS family
MAPVLRAYDLLIVIVALAGMAFAALHAIQGRRGNDGSEYFLARREIGWVPLGVSLFVTTVWGFWSFVLAEPLADGSLGWLLPGAFTVGALMVLGTVFVPRYKASGVATVPSFLSERYGTPVGAAVALASIGLTLFAQIPFTILIGTQLINALTGWDTMSSGLLMVVVPGLFVVAGGYPAMIAAQNAGGIAAGVGVLCLAAIGFPGGAGVLHRALPDTGSSWTLLISGMAILGLWSLCMDQQVVQRVFSARSEGQARAGSLAAAAAVLLGVVALSVGFGRNGSAEPGLGASGFAGGFVVAAILAFAMSTLSGHFMSVATLVSMDIVRPDRKGSGEAALVLVGRLTNTVVVILAILTASSIGLIGPALLDWMIPAVAAIVPPIAAVLLLGLFWPRMHGRGAWWALISGWAIGLTQAGLMSEPGVQTVESAIATFVVSSVVLVLLSLTVAPLGTLGKMPGTVLQVRKP